MPPTRGHDLKHPWLARIESELHDAPHTGARLETNTRTTHGMRYTDAPHTGARLETLTARTATEIIRMPPTRGHDLKQQRAKDSGFR